MGREADSGSCDADVVTGNWPDESIVIIINHGDQNIARGIKFADFPIERLGAALRFLLGTVYGAAIELGLISVSSGGLSSFTESRVAGEEHLEHHDAGRFVWLAEEDRDDIRRGQ